MSVPHTIELDWAHAPSEDSSSPAGERLNPLCKALAPQLVADLPEYKRHVEDRGAAPRFAEILFVTPDQDHTPEHVFSKLRWGGVCLFASPHRRQVDEMAGRYQKYGLAIERGPTSAYEGWCKWPIPLLSKKVHGFLARKIQLLPPGEITHRFTYQVQLAKHNDPNEPIIVHKMIPSVEAVVERLAKKHPDYPAAGLEKLANKFVNKIFPTFLTREAGMLLILQEHLPSQYKKRVPRLIDMVKDDRGFVRELKMSWLRNAIEPLSHMDFAHQSADLLRALHDLTHIIHLDLRLDNFVITPAGVGFVDFGSAVRDNEDLSRNPLLQSLFGELLRTSQIQRMMEKMSLSGQVTSNVIRGNYHKADKAADFFYLALQFNSPHANPELAPLIRYNPGSPEACKLSALTSQILRPADPTQPRFRSAKDIVDGIERIQLGLDELAVAV
jgi:hypothetical protein